MSTFRISTPMRLLALALAAALIVALATQVSAFAQEHRPGPLTPQQSATYADAAEAFRHQRYAAAYGRLIRLADAGHVPSAHLALVMHRNGAALFGNDWYATPAQQRYWSALVMHGERGRWELADEQGD